MGGSYLESDTYGATVASMLADSVVRQLAMRLQIPYKKFLFKNQSIDSFKRPSQFPFAPPPARLQDTT